MKYTTHGDFAARLRDSFARQTVMKTLGISIANIAPGAVELTMPYRADLTQQHGFLHAGIITTALDSAAGYAAFSLMPVDAAVLTVELKTALMAPARGDYFVFRAAVRKPGRTITFAEATAFAITDNGETEKEIATLTATLMTIMGRSDIKG